MLKHVPKLVSQTKVWSGYLFILLGLLMVLMVIRAAFFGHIPEEKRIWVEITLLLLVALVAERLVQQWKQPFVMVLLLLGVLISPYTLNAVWPAVMETVTHLLQSAGIRPPASTPELLGESDYDPVLAAALIAFGFVFIHPFADGDGRIHRYLLHHILAEKGFVPKGLVFPVSAVILARLDEYRRTLEHYSKPRLDLIEWRPADRGNVEILNETVDLYRFFDATAQAEFLFECVAETVDKTLPEEVNYLKKYDLLGEFIKNSIDMPDRTVDLLIRFLDQNNGRLLKRARDKEFNRLTEVEVKTIERKYADIFHGV